MSNEPTMTQNTTSPLLVTNTSTYHTTARDGSKRLRLMHVAHGQKQRTNRLRVLHVAKDAKAAKQPQYHKEREEKVEGAL